MWSITAPRLSALSQSRKIKDKVVEKNDKFNIKLLVADSRNSPQEFIATGRLFLMWRCGVCDGETPSLEIFVRC